MTITGKQPSVIKLSQHRFATEVNFLSLPVAPTIEYGTSNAEVRGSILKESRN